MNIVISPIGIRDLSRMWDQWNKLLTELVKNHFVILVGTQEEGNYFNENIGIKKIHNMCGLVNIYDVFDIIQDCDLFIGIDTGLTHIAIHYGIRTFIIFQKPDIFFRVSHLNFKNVIAFFRPDYKQIIDKI